MQCAVCRQRSNISFKADGFAVDVTKLVVPASYPWGSSISVLEFRDKGEGLYELAMQSGDTIVVVAPNISFKADGAAAA